MKKQKPKKLSYKELEQDRDFWVGHSDEQAATLWTLQKILGVDYVWPQTKADKEKGWFRWKGQKDRHREMIAKAKKLKKAVGLG